VGAPAGTPDAVVNHLAEAFRKGVAEPGYATGMGNLGCTAAWDGPEASLKEMNKIEETFLKLVKKYNLKPE
jgi:tripartite-type tricarboxylate transporter receptor subunit TctC